MKRQYTGSDKVIDEAEAKELLRRVLEGRKFLVVVDDVGLHHRPWRKWVYLRADTR